MRITILILLGVLNFTLNAVGQTVDSLMADSSIIKFSQFNFDDNTLAIDQSDNWKFTSSHNPDFSDPEFDDSDWHNLSPHPDSLSAAKDSLWDGHGWFRFTFRVDSSFYDIPRSLMYDAFGAAEIYLDGKKLVSYGTPSTNAENEILPKILPMLYPAMNLKPAKEHVLAIRYSLHRDEDLNNLSLSGNEDIGAHVHIHRVGQNVLEYQYKLKERAAFLIVLVILLIITLLHLVFYFKFPEDKSNLWVFLLTFHLAIIAGLLIKSRYFEVRGIISLIDEYVILYAFYQFFSN